MAISAEETSAIAAAVQLFTAADPSTVDLTDLVACPFAVFPVGGWEADAKKGFYKTSLPGVGFPADQVSKLRGALGLAFSSSWRGGDKNVNVDVIVADPSLAGIDPTLSPRIARLVEACGGTVVGGGVAPPLTLPPKPAAVVAAVATPKAAAPAATPKAAAPVVPKAAAVVAPAVAAVVAPAKAVAPKAAAKAVAPAKAAAPVAAPPAVDPTAFQAAVDAAVAAALLAAEEKKAREAAEAAAFNDKLRQAREEEARNERLRSIAEIASRTQTTTPPVPPPEPRRLIPPPASRHHRSHPDGDRPDTTRRRRPASAPVTIQNVNAGGTVIVGASTAKRSAEKPVGFLDSLGSSMWKGMVWTIGIVFGLSVVVAVLVKIFA